MTLFIHHISSFGKGGLASRARVIGNDWSMGIRTFEGRAESCDIGCFPDKHGRFHHEMMVREQEEIPVGLDPEAREHE